MSDILVKFFFWLIGIAAVIVWILIYGLTADAPLWQALFVLVSILCGAKACKCHCGSKEEAAHV